MPFVSVIIPAYNCAPYLPTAIESVLSQSHEDLELIVVDDGSTDTTSSILEPYVGRIRLLRQKNAGAAAARNYGLALAKGELIAFLDADDWWEPCKLAAQVTAFEEFPMAGLVFADFFVADAQGKLLMERGIRWKYGIVRNDKITPWSKVFEKNRAIGHDKCLKHHQNVAAYEGRIATWLFQGNMINTCSVLIRRDVLEKVGEFDTSLETEEDYDYWLRVAQSWPIVYIDLPLLTFRRRPGQLTQADKIDRVVSNVAKVLMRAADRLADELSPREIDSRLARIYLDLGVIHLRQGRIVEARESLMESLKRRPQSVSSVLFWLLSFLPVNILSILETAWHRVHRKRT
ncbi:MAG: glycosyltransferase [Proteobacteria bacterium]|nr:MAG: glycosyltransferase [Pseudomonadota bacterium]QKK12059.1 MAG: glycosyltransferase [Pseudomonadota bacterium]